MGSGTISGLLGSDGLSAERPITGYCLQGTPGTPAAGSSNQTDCGHNCIVQDEAMGMMYMDTITTSVG